MYHGLADQNVGTDPQNSIRLYHALNGRGETAALYLYPLEDHGPASKETLLDLWARWSAWLDKHIKNPTKSEPKKTTTTEQASSDRPLAIFRLKAEATVSVLFLRRRFDV